MSCGVGHRHGLDLVLLWLQRRPAAVALIGPLAWETPYAAGAALGKAKRQDKKKKKSGIQVVVFFQHLTMCLIAPLAETLAPASG